MIECIKFKSHKKGNLLGFADIYIKEWGVEIPGFTLWQKDGKRWVNAPSVRYTDKDGMEKSKPFFYFKNKEHWPLFTEKVQKAIDKWCSDNNQQEDPSDSFDDSECPF